VQVGSLNGVVHDADPESLPARAQCPENQLRGGGEVG
jgi:hypothetical protein